MGETMVDAKPSSARLSPARMHHSSWVTTDQEMTRAYWEDVIGLKLHSFWIEDVPYQGETMVLSHSFYELPDGSALTFFNMADPKHQEFFKSPKTEMFHHFAFKVDAAALERLIAALKQRDLHYMIMNHGYCKSLYTTDPNGLRLEFAVDAENIKEIDAMQARTARTTLKEWQDGRRTTNNHLRREEFH